MHAVTMTRVMRAAALMVLSILSLSASAFGWGCEGHQMIALIARAHLTPAASQAVDQLLNRNPVDPSLNRFCKDRPADAMADASTWADDARIIEKTSAWHYIDIRLDAPRTPSVTHWCPPIGPSVNGKERPGCITNAIDYEWAILKDPDRPATERATALRYVIHFVGDIDQPLHDADNSDRGGNCTLLRFFNEEAPANLHAVWDYKLIVRELARENTSLAAYAQILDRQYTRDGKAWAKSEIDSEAWTWEGHRLAVTVAYGDLRPPIPVEAPGARTDCDAERDKVAALHISIGQNYRERTMPVIDEQIAKAGYRLANLLNQTFER
jgi:hypothetical protein